MSIGLLRRACDRRRVLALAVAGLGAAPAAASAEPAAQDVAATDAGQCMRIIVPAYFDPGPEWDRVIAAAPIVSHVIVNPNSGPDEAVNPAILEQVQRCQAAGIKVLGYVFTDLGQEDPEVVKDQIRRYQEWYAVDGIHLDGVQDDAEAIPYYADIAEVIRVGGQPSQPGGEALPGVVMINPGYVPDEGFMAIADIVEVYEYYYANYPGQDFPDWLRNYPADRFAHVVRDAPAQAVALDLTLALARERNAGFVYVTDQTDPTEYRRLPTFWDAMVASVCP
jgi:hypothetical protein